MRILHVSDCYAPRVGGIETQVRALATRQAAAGHEVHVITATRAAEAPDTPDAGVTVHRIALPVGPPVHPRAADRVAAILRRVRPHVAHIHVGGVSPFAWGAMRAACAHDVPTLITVHSLWTRPLTWVARVAEAIRGWTASPMVWSAVSDAAASAVRGALPGIGDVCVIPNGIDPDAWRVTRVPDPIGAVRVISVLRLTPRKRVVPLMRVLGRAAHGLGSRPILRITIVGEGRDEVRARRAADRAGLGAVIRFAGRQTPDEIRGLFARHDIYIQPSIHEAFGLAALEARTAGLPVVARRGSGIATFIRDGCEGLLADDDDELARMIGRLARDAALRAVIAAHNGATPPRETWPRVLGEVHGAYDRARLAVAAAGRASGRAPC